ncbi:MAG: hypothetical protein QM689_07595 [Oscillospiraceae bacterium]
MNFRNLDATLFITGTSSYDYGQATLNVAERHCDFFADFVPILKMETPVRIVLRSGEISVLEVEGKTYLSSKHLLRVTEISVMLCPGAEEALEAVLDAQAVIYTPHKKKANLLVAHPCTITAVTASSLTFTCPGFDAHLREKSFLMELGAPLFPYQAELRLTSGGRNLLFGKNAHYTCLIAAIEAPDRVQLLRYIRAKAERFISRLFPLEPL